MKVRFGLVALAILISVGSIGCGSFAKRVPLSGVEEERDPLVLDGPGRQQEQRSDDGGDDDGFMARLLPWNWFG